MAKKLCILDDETGHIDELAGVDLLNGFSALTNISIEDAVKKYLVDCTQHKSKKQQYIENKYFSIFLDFVNSKNRKNISDIKPQDVESFKMSFIIKMKAASVERRMCQFKHFFNKCVEWDYLHKSPFIKVKKLKVENNHFSPWSAKDFEQFIKTTDGDLKYIFKFLWLTGCRPRELINLKWTDIDYEQKTIRFACGKNAQISRTFPMSKDIDALLHTLPKFNASNVFKFKEKVISSDNLYQACKHRLKRLGLEKLTVYGLRHGFATRMSDGGLNAFEIQYLMGHTDIKTTRKYVHENKNLLIQKMDRVNSKHTY